MMKKKKEFEVGHGGYVLQIMTENEDFVNVWAPESLEGVIPEPMDVEGYDEADAQTYRVRVTEWDGRKKYTLEGMGGRVL